LPPQDAPGSVKQQPAMMISGDTAKSPPPISHEFADMSDQMLGEFRLIRKLGAGGMAEVYLAEQTTLRRQVAVKIASKAKDFSSKFPSIKISKDT
jgi:serine/threonine protein kinase